MRTCNHCHKDISNLDKRATYCDKICRKLDYVNIRTEKIRLESIEYYKDKPISSYVECKVCGHCATDLSNHILKIHKITATEYKQQFDVRVVKCEDECNRVRGDNNPAYQHGGKFSIFSDNFIYNDGSNEFKEKQTIIKQVAYDKSLGKSENRSNKIEYWTKHGFTDDAAMKKLSERQRTFTLEKCIERFGEDKGLDVWKKRQEKWLNTLNSKSDEERADINRRKVTDLTFRSLWKGDIDKPGVFYIIKLINGMIKIGITTKPNVMSRYSKNRNEILEILFEEHMSIKRAFVIEQTLKKIYTPVSIKKEQQMSVFGYTETFNIDYDIILHKYNEITKGNILYGKFIEYYPKAVRHNFEEVCRNL